MLHPATTLNVRGRLLDLNEPVVMGILNVTPDSFFDGGRYRGADDALRQAERMIREGATMLDVGGMSSRPGADIIDEAEELRRVLPVIELLSQNFPDSIISIDTVRSKIARQAVAAGAGIINDISAGRIDEPGAMYDVVASLQVPYVLMHMQGLPGTMQDDPQYAGDVVLDVLDFLIAELGKLRDRHVHDVLIDPGFGFGKTVAHNYALLQRMHVFGITDCPLLAGVSRKSMICKVLGVDPPAALNGTTALHMVALQQGARILRAHDVREARQTILLWQQLEAARRTYAADNV